MLIKQATVNQKVLQSLNDCYLSSGLVLNPPLNVSVEKTSSDAVLIKWIAPPNSSEDILGYKVSTNYRHNPLLKEVRFLWLYICLARPKLNNDGLVSARYPGTPVASFVLNSENRVALV